MYDIEKIPNHSILTNVLEKNNLRLEELKGYESSHNDCYTLWIYSTEVDKTFSVSIPWERFVDGDEPSINSIIKEAIAKPNIR
jgi:hypothetical protein